MLALEVNKRQFFPLIDTLDQLFWHQFFTKHYLWATSVVSLDCKTQVDLKERFQTIWIKKNWSKASFGHDPLLYKFLSLWLPMSLHPRSPCIQASKVAMLKVLVTLITGLKDIVPAVLWQMGAMFSTLLSWNQRWGSGNHKSLNSQMFELRCSRENISCNLTDIKIPFRKKPIWLLNIQLNI